MTQKTANWLLALVLLLAVGAGVLGATHRDSGQTVDVHGRFMTTGKH